MAEPHRIAAVVPAWNEAGAIAGVVRGTRAAGACCVFVVDAGSVDGTQDAAREAGARVIDEAAPGYGRACMAGACAARGHELIAFLDGDGSCDPCDLPALATEAERGSDVVLGRRLRIEPGSLAAHARLGNALVTALLRARTGRAVHDLAPMKVVRADSLEALNLDDRDYGWTVQLVARALAHPGLRVVEAPVSFRKRAGGRSKVSGRLVPSTRAALAMAVQGVTGSRPRGLLVLMAKAPGERSKTRLREEVGAPAANAFWEACLRDAGALLRSAARTAGLNAIAMTPSPADAVEVRRLTGLPALAQREGGLGPALLEVSGMPAPFTIAVSADAPSLPEQRLLDAVDALRTRPAVLGPGDDGGYYLVGLRRGVPAIRRRRAFLEAPMGSASVLGHTLRALGTTALLEPWPDVDTLTDLRRLAAGLEADPGPAPALAAWLAGRPPGVEPEAS